MSQDDFKKLTELLTELRWLRLVFVTFLPEGGKERRAHEQRLKEMSRLHDLCEKEALKS